MSTPKGGAPRAAGFSIAEMTVSISLVAIASLAALPQLSAFHRQYQLSSAALQVGFEIGRSRMQAIGQNRFVRIRVLGDSQYVRECSTDGVTFFQDGSAMVLPKGIAIASGPNGAPRFDRKGLAQSTTSIVLRSAAGQKTVQISVLGRVSIS